MATVTIEIQGSTMGTVRVTDTLSQEHSDRMMAWLAATYGIEPADPDAEGSQPRQRTPAEMVAACWAGIRAGVFANILRFEQAAAAAAAREAVTPIESSTEVAHEEPA